MIRVLIVDDHPIFRLGLSVALEELEDIELAGQVDRARDVEDAVAALRPDVVLLDLGLGDGSGLDVNRALATRFPEVRVIMLTMAEDQDALLTAIGDGARGYLVKGASPERVRQAIVTVVAGDVVIDHALTHAVTELARLRVPSASRRPFPQLTDREVDVLDLVARGLDNRSIARRLSLSEKTVRNHVSNILAKTHVADRARVIVLARDAGLGRTRDG